MFNSTFIAGLDALCAQHGIARNMSGNKITLIDSDGAEDQGRQTLRLYGHYYGLSEQDYGTVFVSQGKRFKLVGVKTSRPKYPLQCESMGDGRVFKFGTNVVKQIVALRTAQPTPPTIVGAQSALGHQQVTPTPANNNYDGALDGLSQF